MSIFYKKNTWNKKKINWKNIHKNLLKLQNRVVLQIEKKNFRKARNLQRLILRSISSHLITSQKILEIQNFEHFNLYKNNYKEDFLTIFNINNFIHLDTSLDYKFNIHNQKHFIYIQFLSLLWLLAILPVSETLTNSFFYNNRLYRDHTDILSKISQLLKDAKIKWILIIKPIGFFTDKNQKWLIKNTLIEKKFLIYIIKFQKLANSSIRHYKYNQGIKKISLLKLLTNFSFYDYTKNKNLLIAHLKYTLFYNGLLIIPCINLNKLKNYYRLIFSLLQVRGLSVKKNRVWVLHARKGEGFNFLGWSLKQEKNKVSINISYKNIKSHQLEIKKFLKSTRFMPIDFVITKLNKKITNWQTYYAYSTNMYKVWSDMNYYLFWRIWHWCKKRHKNKGSKWLYSRYWSYQKQKKWVFNFNNCYLKSYSLNQQKIVHLSASLNVCKIKNLALVKNILFQKYPIDKYQAY